MVLAGFAAPAKAAACGSFFTFSDTQAATSCTLGPNNEITFSGFTSTLQGVTVVALPLNGNNPGTVGFSFVPTGGASGPYSISYTATCDATCTITGGNDQATNSTGAGSYNYSLGTQSVTAVANGASFNPSFPGMSSVVNTGAFVSGGTNQNLTLDVNIQPQTATPEPSTITLFGSSLLLLGTLRMRRK